MLQFPKNELSDINKTYIDISNGQKFELLLFFFWLILFGLGTKIITPKGPKDTWAHLFLTPIYDKVLTYLASFWKKLISHFFFFTDYGTVGGGHSITPTKRNSLSQHEHSTTSLHDRTMPEPRFISFQKLGSVGIRLTGGNEVIFYSTNFFLWKWLTEVFVLRLKRHLDS